MNYYSEFGEDQWIAEHLKLPDKGVFLDVGAGPPRTGNNTAFLRDLGWSGVAIDANPGYAESWRQEPNTVFVTGIVSDKPLVPFEFKEIPGHSRIEAGKTLMIARRLDAILHILKMPPIDFLSLDIEGHEFEALQTLPWDSPPKIIVSEFSTASLRDDFRVRDFLTFEHNRIYSRGHGIGLYNLAYQNPSNMIFTLR